MTTLANRLARLRSSQGGFTLIELMIAVMLLAVGILALVSGFESSRSMVSLSERNETATHRAQQEVERILAMDYSEVALKSLPAPSGDQANPAYYVKADGTYQWDQGPSGPKADRLVVDPAAGAIEPVTQWQDGRLKGEVHVFVTELWDDKLKQTPDVADARRVTVAVTVAGKGGPAKPVVVTSVAFDRGTPE